MRPLNEVELAEAVRDAQGPLRIVGGGTRTLGAVAGEVLETSGLAGISLYEPGALTLVAGAGTPLAEIDAALAAEGQRLPFEVPDFRRLLGRDGISTIGGVVAANASGPRRVQAGACRDSLIGVRFVDGAGTVIKNGGRVMKNVTGYDLVKLMAGARGTLGVLSEVSFKVLPQPEAQATLVRTGLDAQAAVAAMASALGSPYEITGAAYLSVGGEVRLRIEGMAGSVAYRRDALAKLLGPGWDLSVDAWEDVRDVTQFSGAAGTVWRISVKPSDMPEVLERLGSPAAVCDWGGGLIWVLLEDAVDARSAMAGLAGHAVLFRGQGLPVFHPEPAPLAAIAKGLRAKFDPRGILNPGLMG